MGSRHLLLIGAGEVRDGGVVGALHPLLLLAVLPRRWGGRTLCPWRGGPALLKKKKFYPEKHLDLTIKLSRVSVCNPSIKVTIDGKGARPLKMSFSLKYKEGHTYLHNFLFLTLYCATIYNLHLPLYHFDSFQS